MPNPQDEPSEGTDFKSNTMLLSAFLNVNMKESEEEDGEESEEEVTDSE